jgi:hypothetical protein
LSILNKGKSMKERIEQEKADALAMLEAGDMSAAEAQRFVARVEVRLAAGVFVDSSTKVIYEGTKAALAAYQQAEQ